MRNFELGSLAEWQTVGVGELLDFPIPDAAEYRKIEFDLMASASVAVYAISGDNSWLLAVGEGWLSVRFGTDMSVAIVVEGDPSTNVSIRTLTEMQVIPQSDEASYTTVEPRPAGPSDEFKRMMQFVQLNQKRRDREVSEEMASLRQQLKDATKPPAASPAPAPDPSPAPAPAPAPEAPPAAPVKEKKDGK